MAIPPELERLILDCLKKIPTERPTILEVAERLRAVPRRTGGRRPTAQDGGKSTRRALVGQRANRLGAGFGAQAGSAGRLWAGPPSQSGSA